MKKILFIILLSTGLAAHAQQKTEPTPGSWVIESNASSPKKQTVKFYNPDQQLLYQEDYNRKILNCSRKRVRKMLDDVLVTVLNKNSAIKNPVLVKLIKHNN